MRLRYEEKTEESPNIFDNFDTYPGKLLFYFIYGGTKYECLVFLLQPRDATTSHWTS